MKTEVLDVTGGVTRLKSLLFTTLNSEHRLHADFVPTFDDISFRIKKMKE